MYVGFELYHSPCSRKKHNLHMGNLSAEVDTSELLVSMGHITHFFQHVRRTTRVQVEVSAFVGGIAFST